jgi:hypothetical protein
VLRSSHKVLRSFPRLPCTYRPEVSPPPLRDFEIYRRRPLPTLLLSSSPWKPSALPALPPGKAAANRPFTFLGALGPVHSSVNFPLPEVGDEPEPLMGPVKLGVSVEDAVMLPPPPDDRRVERVALRVARDPIL